MIELVIVELTETGRKLKDEAITVPERVFCQFKISEKMLFSLNII